ncbi:DUF1588 domain-containing protein [Paraglaciecola sp.]|uniref:DUF1588 domain-containing protein n=1 Tax=Paraglaciecola sp. TaxID=1920173 RepID=UPI003EF3D556
MINKSQNLILCVLTSVFLSACGGGGGSGSTNSGNTSPPAPVPTPEPTPQPDPTPKFSAELITFYEQKVASAVVQASCISCHTSTGIAKDSGLALFIESSTNTLSEDNVEVFHSYASTSDGAQKLKDYPRGLNGHPGANALGNDPVIVQDFQEFVDLLTECTTDCATPTPDPDPEPIPEPEPTVLIPQSVKDSVAYTHFSDNIANPIIQGGDISKACSDCHSDGGVAVNQGAGLVFVKSNDAEHVVKNYLSFVSFLIDNTKPKYVLDKASATIGHAGGNRVPVDSKEYDDLSLFLTSLNNQVAFTENISSQVVLKKCIACHVSGGQAPNDGATLVFTTSEEPNHLALNHQAFVDYVSSDSQRLNLLAKVRGDNNHQGQVQFTSDTDEYVALSAYVDSLAQDNPNISKVEFFKDIQFDDNRATLKRAASILAGRQPTDDEYARVVGQTDETLKQVIIEDLMTGDGFHQFLLRGANDNLLTDLLLLDLDQVSSLKATDYNYPAYTNKLYSFKEDDVSWYNRRQYEIPLNYAITRAPLELIAYVVEEDKPYSEVLTADYLMVNEASNLMYKGLDEDGVDFSDAASRRPYLKESDIFLPTTDKGRYLSTGPGNAYENGDLDIPLFRPERATQANNMKQAGVLNTFAFLKRYPSTETNRNRARARWTMKHFLGFDIEASEDRTTDPVALADTNNPTMNNPACTVCHVIMDPLAGAYQNYNDDGFYRARNGGKDSLPWQYVFRLKDENGDNYYANNDTWYDERLMRAPGYFHPEQGAATPAPDNDHSLSWVADQIVDDSRFNTAAVQFWWPSIFGAKPVLQPEDGGSESQQMLFDAQSVFIQQLANEFKTNTSLNAQGQNVKVLLANMIVSDWFRATGSSIQSSNDDVRQTALLDVGSEKLLTPEELEFKTKSLTGFEWNTKVAGVTNLEKTNLTHEYNIFLGGLDSDSVTERSKEVSTLMANVTATHAVEASCEIVLNEFSKPAANRLLFSDVESTSTPESNETEIKETIKKFHHLFLSESLTIDSAELDFTYDLFVNVRDAKLARISDGKSVNINEEGTSCPGATNANSNDSNGIKSAWRAVIAYLMMDYKFNHE